MVIPAVGALVDVEKFPGAFYGAVVQECKGGKVLVHYDGWSEKCAAPPSCELPALASDSIAVPAQVG